MSLREKIAAVIVTYNSAKWIRQCIESLLNSSVCVDRILIVDNDSKDNTIDIAVGMDPRIVVLRGVNNLGFGKANNLGVKWCLESEYKWILLLNPDAKVGHKSIEKAIEGAKVDEKIAVVGGVELKYENDQYSYYTELLAYNAIGKESGFLNVYEKKGQNINGAFMLLRAEAIRVIGLFDPIYRMYFEESDFLRRVIKERWKVVLCPAVQYHHGISGSYSRNHVSDRYMAKDKLRNYAASEAIFRLTDPGRPILKNVLSYCAQILRDVWIYRSEPALLITSVGSATGLPFIECINKLKRDRAGHTNYYLKAIENVLM